MNIESKGKKHIAEKTRKNREKEHRQLDFLPRRKDFGRVAASRALFLVLARIAKPEQEEEREQGKKGGRSLEERCEGRGRVKTPPTISADGKLPRRGTWAARGLRSQLRRSGRVSTGSDSVSGDLKGDFGSSTRWDFGSSRSERSSQMEERRSERRVHEDPKASSAVLREPSGLESAARRSETRAGEV